MQKETITLYKDFSHPEKELEMSEIVNIIRSDKLKPQVEAIRRAVSRKQKDEVTRLKAELPKVSFSAGYCHSRRPKNLLRHNHLIIIDIDKITPQELSNLKRLAADDRHLRMGFESPSGNGYKMLYAIEPEADDSSQPDAIVAYHARGFDTVKRYVQLRYNLHPDSSGKDVGRLCYLAYDPHALFCPESIPIKPLTYYSRRSELEKRADARRKAIAEALSPEIVDKEHARNNRYAEGNRNNYLFGLACACNRYGIDLQETDDYMAKHYADLPADERKMALESAYGHVEEHGTMKMKKNEQRLAKLKTALNADYDFRRNTVTERIEWKLKGENDYRWLEDVHENSIWCKLQEDGNICPLHMLHTLLNSDFTPDYNPFTHYFDRLPVWDGTVDHIGRLAETVHTTHNEIWSFCLKKWLVGMVAAAVDDGAVNHTVLILSGRQSVGKSRFCKRLLPAELQPYFSNGMVDPDNKDDLVRLTQHMLINLDDIEIIGERKLGKLKSLITNERITLRMVYQRNMREYPHRASFIASSNYRKVLTDLTGNRRFLCFETLNIDNEVPIDHAALYAQAYTLFRSGFRYWIEQEELGLINDMNEAFREAPMEEELLFTFFRAPQEGDTVSYLSATEILSKLLYKSGIGSGQLNSSRLGKVLLNAGFEQSRRKGKTIYAVHEIEFNEVEKERTQKGA